MALTKPPLCMQARLAVLARSRRHGVAMLAAGEHSTGCRNSAAVADTQGVPLLTERESWLAAMPGNSSSDARSPHNEGQLAALSGQTRYRVKAGVQQQPLSGRLTLRLACELEQPLPPQFEECCLSILSIRLSNLGKLSCAGWRYVQFALH